jgi:hypothetical protein
MAPSQPPDLHPLPLQGQTQELRSTVELLQKLTSSLEASAAESQEAAKDALTLPELRAELRSMVATLKE